MPRDIGARTGVNDTATGDCAASESACEISGVPMGAADAVGARGADDPEASRSTFEGSVPRPTCR